VFAAAASQNPCGGRQGAMLSFQYLEASIAAVTRVYVERDCFPSHHADIG
jgi:hypothetical protein